MRPVRRSAAPIRVSAMALCAIAACSAVAGADEFLPGEGGDFFSGRGAPASPATTSSRRYYAFAVDAGIQSFGINEPSRYNLELEWSPFRHVGISLGVGALVEGQDGFCGPAHESWARYNEYLTIGDEADWSEFRYIYQIAYFGNLPVLGVDLGLSLYVGRRGLSGLFVGADLGGYFALAEPTYHLDWNYQAPITAVGGGAAPLPHHGQFAVDICPYLGYKLVVAGLFIEPKLGYAVTSLGTGNGYTIVVNAGYAFGGH